MGDCGEFTMMATPEEGDDDLFGDQLATLTTSLGLPPPEFRGKQLPPTAPGDHRWIIEGNVRGRLVRTETQDIVFYKMSPNWEIGVEMAMQEALARTVQTYQHEMSQGSSFYAFGRRFEDGTANRTAGDRVGMDYRVIQMEDLECHIVNLEESLTAEMRKNENLRVTIEKLKRGNTELTMELCDMDDKLIARDTEITELKNAMTPKETPAVPHDQDTQNEEEDPEERIAFMPNGEELEIVSEEEDTPTGNTPPHQRRTISTRTYHALLNK
jgi:low affinity Fe/Cu permease